MLNINNKGRHDRCPLCNSESIKNKGVIPFNKSVLFSTHLISFNYSPELWKCITCDSGFIQNYILKEEAEELYKSGEGNKRWAYSSFEVDKPHNVIKALDKYIFSDQSILDIGCNTGEFLDFAKNKKAITFGIELNEISRKIIREKGHTDLESIKDYNKNFDIITAFDLVEHLYDVPSFVNSCKEKLKTNGILIILTGNINSAPAKIASSNWWYLKYPEHVIFPSQKYYSQLEGWSFVESISTYANKEQAKLFSYRNLNGIISLIKTVRYNGIPAFTGDHHLIILRKN